MFVGSTFNFLLFSSSGTRMAQFPSMQYNSVNVTLKPDNTLPSTVTFPSGKLKKKKVCLPAVKWTHVDYGFFTLINDSITSKTSKTSMGKSGDNGTHFCKTDSRRANRKEFLSVPFKFFRY